MGDWPGSSAIGKAASERFRSRIEDLVLVLERALERRRVAATPVEVTVSEPAAESATAELLSAGVESPQCAAESSSPAVKEELSAQSGTTIPDAITTEAG